MRFQVGKTVYPSQNDLERKLLLNFGQDVKMLTEVKMNDPILGVSQDSFVRAIKRAVKPNLAILDKVRSEYFSKLIDKTVKNASTTYKKCSVDIVFPEAKVVIDFRKQFQHQTREMLDDAKVMALRAAGWHVLVTGDAACMEKGRNYDPISFVRNYL